MHGHRWEAEIFIETKDEGQDIIIDFHDLEAIVAEFDHKVLNDILDVPPTAENIARDIALSVAGQLTASARISVTVRESPEASVQYMLYSLEGE
jgi:6-pyruvoyltetrahydropterin/6-carboxytetrahydropterin synthase